MKIRPNKCGNHCTRVNHVNVTLEGDSILKDVNFSLLCGEMITLIGKNGAGKSTLVKALLGEVPYEGEILFEDRRNGRRGNMRIGYVPQQLSFDKNTPTTVYDFFASCISKVPVWLWKKKSVYEKIKKELERFQAQDLIDKRMGDLSGGELQRVLLSVATCPKPNLLILDEPISGIDREGTILFYEILDHLKKEDDLSILMVSHDLDFTYEYSDRVLLINQTVIEDGSPREVYQSPAFVEFFGKLPFVEENSGAEDLSKIATENLKKNNKHKKNVTEKAAPYDASYKKGGQ
ncbi:MAG: metal ABC transporter ATP-binding protein [Eubacteriales bacterium]|nr:metal ABC transporter ATP-binding protein [Eubacteriales bacterium]